MQRQRIGLLVGSFAGAWPFWSLALLRSDERRATWVALALAVILSAAALRAPALWAVGIAVGVVISWVGASRHFSSGRLAFDPICTCDFLRVLPDCRSSGDCQLIFPSRVAGIVRCMIQPRRGLTA